MSQVSLATFLNKYLILSSVGYGGTQGLWAPDTVIYFYNNILTNRRKSGDAGRPRTISNEMAEVHVKLSNLS